ncbi:MAG: YggT family protein [Granulosicoccaceae bacterium]
MNPALSALGFIVSTVLNIYALLVGLRFVMQLVRADYYNPLAQFIVKATDPLLKPLRKVIPSIKKYDTSSLLLCFLVLLVKFVLFKVLMLGPLHVFTSVVNPAVISMTQFFTGPAIDLIALMFNVFIYAIMIQALLSWLPAAQGNPMTGMLRAITEPVLTPIRRYMPPLGTLDLSALVAILGLFALKIMTIGYLFKWLGPFV